MPTYSHIMIDLINESHMKLMEPFLANVTFNHVTILYALTCEYKLAHKPISIFQSNFCHDNKGHLIIVYGALMLFSTVRTVLVYRLVVWYDMVIILQCIQ